MRLSVDTLPLFPILNNALIAFLKQLSAEDWQRQTIAKKWTVKDVAAHLLDGNFKRIALHRDGWTAPAEIPIRSFDELVGYLNDFNADWVKAAKRLSPEIIIELLASTNEVVYEEFLKLDPYGVAAYSVSWAGENESFNWFDIAREYTERWLHQQQIRDAVNDRSLMTAELYQPFLTVFMQAWPHSMKNVKAAEGTVLKAVVTGIGEWYLVSGKDGWELGDTVPEKIIAETIIQGDIAWKLFSKSIRKDDVKEGITIKGDPLLAEKILDMVSVMA